VIAHAFDNGQSAGVANRKALACAAGSVERAGSRAVKRYVAEDHMLRAFARRTALTAEDQLSAAETLADKVVGQALRA
jgi:hypothetical protein